MAITLVDCWPVEDSCRDFSDYEEEVVERAMLLAVETLRSLTANRVGGCPVIVRPCSNGCAESSGYYTPSGFAPHINLDGQWVNGCGCPARRCSCRSLSYVRLRGPVASVRNVWLDGELLTPADYFIMDGTDLVRIDGEWPACQDLTAEHDAVGAFAVEYDNSYPPGLSGSWAAGLLAYEFAKACSGGDCELPAGVTSVVRQGISYEIPAGSFPDGQTGLIVVDAFVRQWNPNHLTREAEIWSPDVQGQVVRR